MQATRLSPVLKNWSTVEMNLRRVAFRLTNVLLQSKVSLNLAPPQAVVTSKELMDKYKKRNIEYLHQKE